MIVPTKIIGRETVKGEKTSAPKAGASKTAGAAAGPAPTDGEIAKQAYELYLARGDEIGHAGEDWAQAESERRWPDRLRRGGPNRRG